MIYKLKRHSDSNTNYTDSAAGEKACRNFKVENGSSVKENQRPVAVTNNSRELQHEFERKRFSLEKRCTVSFLKPTAPITVAFSDIITSFNCDIRLSFNKELRNGRAPYKYLGATSNNLLNCIDPALKEGKSKRQLYLSE